ARAATEPAPSGSSSCPAAYDRLAREIVRRWGRTFVERSIASWTDGPPARSVTISGLFAALRHRSFRLIWWGLLLSWIGTFMQSAGMLWHVSLLVPDNRRALALGLVGLARIGPIFLFSLISGVAADALNRRRLMLATQTMMAVLAGVLALLALRGLSVVWPI